MNRQKRQDKENAEIERCCCSTEQLKVELECTSSGRVQPGGDPKVSNFRSKFDQYALSHRFHPITDFTKGCPEGSEFCAMGLFQNWSVKGFAWGYSLVT